jgi:hypothetical protein
MVSGLTVSSRAMTALTSVGWVASTRRNTRSISDPVLFPVGRRVARGPVITTPVWSPSLGMTRDPGLARRVRLGLAKSS